MQNYSILIDEMEPGAYQIALIPSVRHGAMGTTRYPNKDFLVAALRRHLGYTDAAIESFFAAGVRHTTLLNFQLSDDDAAALGWSPEFNSF
jgi:hypothetical protein